MARKIHLDGRSYENEQVLVASPISLFASVLGQSSRLSALLNSPDLRKVFSDVRTNSPGSTMPSFAGPAKKSKVMFKKTNSLKQISA